MVVTRKLEKNIFTARQSWSRRFGRSHELVNVKLPGDTGSSRQAAAVEFVPRIEELQAALALHVVQGVSCKMSIWMERTWNSRCR